jgi:hypothetical protein
MQLSKNSPPILIDGKTYSEISNLRLVGVDGFEPSTLRLSSACSNQLSYTPVGA